MSWTLLERQGVLLLMLFCTLLQTGPVLNIFSCLRVSQGGVEYSSASVWSSSDQQFSVLHLWCALPFPNLQVTLFWCLYRALPPCPVHTLGNQVFFPASHVCAVPHTWSEIVWGRAALSALHLPSSPLLPSQIPGRGKLASVRVC